MWKLKGKIVQIRRSLQMIVPLKLRNDFNDNSNNNNKNHNNDDGENNNVNNDSLNLCDDLDDFLHKTDLSENRKSKWVAAINAGNMHRLNDENFE